MNAARPFSRSFRKPFDLLSTFSRAAGVQLPSSADAHQRSNSANSLDGTDDYYPASSGSNANSNMEARRSHSTQNSLSELQPAVPLIDLGFRSTSPYPRVRSAAQSDVEDDDDDTYGPVSSIRPLVGHGTPRGGYAGTNVLEQGGLGAFLFGTWAGWQVWVGFLVFWVGGCSFGLLLMNRFIMLTGVYKFPFPLTGTWVQLLITHALLILMSSLTRFIGGGLRWLGLGAAVAPSTPVASGGGGYRRETNKSAVKLFTRWLLNGSGGIAGGGLLEFDWQIAKQVFPLAVVFVVRVLLSNYSFAYAPLRTYQMARIGITPLAILFACLFSTEALSAPTLSATLIATLNLAFASYKPHERVTWESIVAGVFSSIFVALHPILLLRTYRILLARLKPAQQDILAGYPSPSFPADESVETRDGTRAYYQTLHYTSLLSLALLTPLTLLSGEPTTIYTAIPFLDVPFFGFMLLFGAMGSTAVFASTLLLVRATSPLSATFVSVPRTAFQLVAISLGRLEATSWVGVVLCWVSCVWFAVARREEGRRRERGWLEGR